MRTNKMEVELVKATMKDVAKLAGVGVGSVSRVINNVPVKESTASKVKAAIKELNYEPDIYARGLKTNKTQTVALILPTVWHPFFSEFAYYVEEALEEKNYKMYLCNSDGKSAKEYEYIQMVKQNKVDGIIGITYSDIDQYISTTLPFVSIDRYFTEDVIYVTADNIAGGKIAANELKKRGAKNVAFIGGHQEIPNETKNRRKHFQLEAERLGLNCAVLDLNEPISDLISEVEKFLIAHPEIDGIFTITDLAAVDVIKAIKKLEKRVPEDIQVIGFDGLKMTLATEYLVSTIVQPVEEMAKTAVALLLDVIQGKGTPSRTVLPVFFAEGNTTKNVIL